jgi:hypothetical protein
LTPSLGTLSIEQDSLRHPAASNQDLRTHLRVHFAVSLNVMLGGFLGMFGGVNGVAVGQLGVVGGRFVIATLMMLCGFVVVARSVLVVFRCLGVMMCCFF